MSWLPLFALVAWPRGCGSPPTEGSEARISSPDLPRELPASWDLGQWLLPSSTQQDAYDAQGRHARVVEWVDQDCIDASDGCFTFMSANCGRLDLEITEGETPSVVRLAQIWFVRGSAPLWVDADHVLVATNDGVRARLLQVQREGDFWSVSAPLFELENAWMEPLAVVGQEVLVRVTAARFRWENEGVVTGWRAQSPEELREVGAGATHEWVEWMGESLHRLYWLDLEERQLQPADASALWHAAWAW
jgi:hypothetical protein